MRRFAVAASLVTVVLAGGAACSGTKPTGKPRVAATTVAADQTKVVCAAAIQESTTAAAAYTKLFDDLIADVTAGKEPDTDALEKEMYQLLTNWQTKLTEWSGKPVKPAVKTALDGALATVKKHNDVNDSTPLNATKTDLNGVATKLSAACA